MKTLIVYFTYTFNTYKIAKKILDELQCDIFEIKTVEPYSSDYETVVNDEHNSERSNYIPEILNGNLDVSKYDRIILGTPVWWYRAAPAVRAFLLKYDLKDKIIIPFATNAGWLGKTFKEIKKLCPNSIVEKEISIKFVPYKDELVTKEQDINTWIESLK